MVIDKELRHRSPYFYTFFPQKDLIPAELPEIKPRIMPVAAFQTDLFQLLLLKNLFPLKQGLLSMLQRPLFPYV